MDSWIPDRGVIMFESSRSVGGNISVGDLITHVMYWQATGGLPRLIMASFRGWECNGCLKIGARPDCRLSTYNAAIGRRVCPDCYEDSGIKAPVVERGQDKGRCSHCDQQVDYIMSTYPPYFFYFSHQAADGGLHIAHGTAEQLMADRFKQAMVDQPVRDVTFPHRVKYYGYDNWVSTDLPAWRKPLVFCIDELGLTGRFGSTVFDFRV